MLPEIVTLDGSPIVTLSVAPTTTLTWLAVPRINKVSPPDIVCVFDPSLTMKPELDMPSTYPFVAASELAVGV